VTKETTPLLVPLAAILVGIGIGWWMMERSGLDFGQALYLLVGVILTGI